MLWQTRHGNLFNRNSIVICFIAGNRKKCKANYPECSQALFTDINEQLEDITQYFAAERHIFNPYNDNELCGSVISLSIILVSLTGNTKSPYLRP